MNQMELEARRIELGLLSLREKAFTQTMLSRAVAMLAATIAIYFCAHPLTTALQVLVCLIGLPLEASYFRSIERVKQHEGNLTLAQARSIQNSVVWRIALVVLLYGLPIIALSQGSQMANLVGVIYAAGMFFVVIGQHSLVERMVILTVPVPVVALLSNLYALAPDKAGWIAFGLGVMLSLHGYRIARAGWFTSNAMIIAKLEAEQLAVELEAKRVEAERATRAKSHFLANMSHEIRTPMNGVIAVAGILDRTQLDDHQRELLDLIQNSGETLRRVLDDVLDMSKIEAGRLELEVRPFDLGPEIRSAAFMMSARALEKGIDFQVEIDPAAEGTYIGDGVRVRQIVANLASNAVKFTQQGGVYIWVGLDQVEGSTPPPLKILVSDTGIGFDDEARARLFQRFEQADPTITRIHGGTGLGLSIVRSLAELMGGSVEAQSIPGKGSTFTVLLPLQRVQEAQTAAPADLCAHPIEGMAPARLRILLAEDHVVNQRVVSLILAPLQAELVIVENGQQAVEACRTARFDLILMDMQMPVMDGLRATRAIREWEQAEGLARTPIAMLTANAMREHREQAIEAGCDTHIAKPVTPQDLISGINALLLSRSEDPPSLADDAGQHGTSQTA